MRVPVEPDATWTAGVPTRLLEGQYFDGGAIGISTRTYDVSPDDRRFLMIKEGEIPRDVGGPALIVVQNWQEELKRLVPTR